MNYQFNKIYLQLGIIITKKYHIDYLRDPYFRWNNKATVLTIDNN